MPLRLAHLFRSKHAQDQADDLRCWRGLLAGGKERESAFLELYTRYGATVKSLYVGEGLDHFSAQDMAHDVMVKVLVKCDQYYQTETFRSWLFKVVENSMKDVERQARNRNRLLEKNLAKRTSPIHLVAPSTCTADRSVLNDCIMQHFSAFEKTDRKGATIIRLAMLEDFQDKEIAYALDISNDSLRQYKSKARKALKKLLEYCRDLVGENA